MADDYVMSEAELAMVRGGGQQSKIYLAIPAETAVYRAALASIPAAGGVAQLATTKIDGDVSLALADMTALVKDSAEAKLKGVLRVRKASTNSVLYIGEVAQGSIDWEAGDHLVVIDDFQVFPRHLRILNDTTVYMDYDVAYSDQHTHPDPLVNMGPDAAVWLHEGETVDLPFGDAAWVFIDTIASYSWTVSGGLAITGGSTATPTIAVNAAGTYRVSCTATSSAGKSFQGHRYIYAFDDEHPPHELFTLDGDVTVSFDQGGGGFEMTLYGEAGLAQIRERAKVVLFRRDWYPGGEYPQEGSIGPIHGRENVEFTGWIVGETIDWNYQGGFVRCQVKGAQYWMDQIESYPFGLEDTDFSGAGTIQWTRMGDLCLDRAIWHLAMWRSTIGRMMDVHLPGSSRQAATIESAAEKLWGQLGEISEGTVLARPAVDRWGRLHVKLNQAYLPLDERGAIQTVMDITPDDHAQIAIVRRTAPGYSQVEVSGVTYVNGASGPMGARSPGETPAYPGGERLTLGNLATGTQAETLEMAGLTAGAAAGEIEAVSASFPQNNPFWVPGVYQWATLSVEAAETERGITLAGLRLMPREVRRSFDSEAGAWTTGVDFEPEGGQWGAVAMSFKGEDEPAPGDGGDGEVTDTPPDPPGPGGGGDPPPTPGPANAIVSAEGDVRTANDFYDTTPTWVTEL